MRELIDVLNAASYNYYQRDKEIMTDKEYDELYDELLELEKSLDVTLSDSPSLNIGFEVLSDLKKVSHGSRILSLDKTKDEAQLLSWIGEREAILSWKLDGLTIVLNYENGELHSALTRGNGEVGEDITHNALVFQNIPIRIPEKGIISVRGEAVISFSQFTEINASQNEANAYKNPRNLVSGTVRQLNSQIAKDRKVEFFAFAVLGLEAESGKKSENLENLKKYGFSVVEYSIVKEKDLISTVHRFLEKLPNNDYTSDGLVLTFDDILYSESLGATSKFPRDSIAFKWSDQTADTVLVDMLWNTSRTGRINPVAIFEPVDLEGSTIRQASVHNISILESLELGLGDEISVYKANMIIPQIDENYTRSGKIEIPKTCRSCGADTIIEEELGVKVLYCTNPNCNAKILKSLTHFTSREGMNIEGLSEERLKSFVDEGFIEDYTDIYTLNEFQDQICKLRGFGDKSYNNIIDAVDKSRNPKLENLVYALGILQVGMSNSKLLVQHFEYDLDKILSAKKEDFENIQGFGPVVAENIYMYFENEENRTRLSKLLEYINIEKIEASALNKTLSDLSFVITGELRNFENRKSLQNLIESMGGKVNSAVSSATKFLINNDYESNSKKNQTAKKLGIEIITEEMFKERFLE